MKKLNLSLVTILAMSTFAIAGGDIAPVEPEVEVMVEETPMIVEDKGLYLGLGYGFLSADRETTVPGNNNNYDQGTADYDQIMLQAGYKFNSNIAIEARYWLGLSDNAWATISDNNIQSVGEIDAFGIYAKPMYPVTPAFDVYALLGYASVDYSITNGTSGDFDGFSWGLGASYDFNNNVAVYVDYTELYNDDTANSLGWSVEDQIDVVTVGVTYQF